MLSSRLPSAKAPGQSALDMTPTHAERHQREPGKNPAAAGKPGTIPSPGSPAPSPAQAGGWVSNVMSTISSPGWAPGRFAERPRPAQGPHHPIWHSSQGERQATHLQRTEGSPARAEEPAGLRINASAHNSNGDSWSLITSEQTPASAETAQAVPPPPQTHLRKRSPLATEAILQQEEEEEEAEEEEGSHTACLHTRVRPCGPFLRAEVPKQHQPLPALPPHKRPQCSHPYTVTTSARSARPPLRQRRLVQPLLSRQPHGRLLVLRSHRRGRRSLLLQPPPLIPRELWLSHRLFALVPSPSHLAQLPG